MPIIKDAFNDLKATPLPETEGIGGYDDLRNVSAIQVGTGARAFKADQDGIFLGANKFATALFSVTMAGKVVATDGTFSGAITAATIDIGGADATSFHVDIDGNIWSGHADFASGVFKVSNAGVLTLTGTSSSISIGSANSIFKADSNGIYLGNATFASAPFRVTPAGALVATSATITGAVTATSGAIGGFTIESGYLYAGTGANTCGLSPADYPFWAGDTYANRATAPFKVTPAGAITCSNITVTGGSISGWTAAATTLSGGNTILDSAGTITVANGDDKVVMTVATGVGYLDFYAGGSLRARIRGNTAASGGAQLTQGDFAIANNYSFLAKGTGASYARFGVTSSNDTWLVTSDDDTLNVLDSDEATLFTINQSNMYLPDKTVQLKEVSEPSNPSTANTGLIFMKDNGAGKTQLCVRFVTGATQVIKTEP